MDKSELKKELSGTTDSMLYSRMASSGMPRVNLYNSKVKLVDNVQGVFGENGSALGASSGNTIQIKNTPMTVSEFTEVLDHESKHREQFNRPFLQKLASKIFLETPTYINNPMEIEARAASVGLSYDDYIKKSRELGNMVSTDDEKNNKKKNLNEYYSDKAVGNNSLITTKILQDIYSLGAK
jgi:hypothetical protein